MPAERYFYTQPLEKDSSIFIEEQEFHHLIHVMRSREGDPIEIVNGMGQLATGHIQAIEKKRAVILIENVETQSPSNKELILAQAVPRINRLEYILEKCTELGATEFWLYSGAYSEKKNFSDHQVERLQAITIAAMKQCGRLFLPKLIIMPPIKTWKPFPFPAFFGDTQPSAPQLAKIWHQSPKAKVMMCIGPESGFSPEEIEMLKACSAEGVSLHSNILRTDTAAIAALSILSQF